MFENVQRLSFQVIIVISSRIYLLRAISRFRSSQERREPLIGLLQIWGSKNSKNITQCRTFKT